MNTSFTRSDYRLLSNNYIADVFYFIPKRKLYTPFVFISQLYFLIINFNKYDVYLSQFAGYHSFLPNLFSKIRKVPAIMILGGTDCVSFPSIKYGNFNRSLLAIFTRLSFKLASAALPVHKSLEYSKYTYTKDDYQFQGYKYFMKDLKITNYEVYNGYDSNLIQPIKNLNRIPNSFLTVTQSVKKPVYYRKGIDLFIQLAISRPQYKFTIVGVDTTFPDINAPQNLELCPPVKYEELINIYSRHEFYLQNSICEGFPNALCEAMLCNCIPIGSDVAGIPDIIGETGFLLKERNINMLLDLVDKAVVCNKVQLGADARFRIKLNFPIEKREKKLVQVIQSELRKKNN